MVRLRNAMGPRVAGRYGETGYRVFWWLVMLTMVIIANMGLALLRSYLSGELAEAQRLPVEICFGCVALLTGGALAIYRARQCR